MPLSFPLCSSNTPAPSGNNVVKFAVVADVQHADKANGYAEGRTQYYRSAPLKLQKAIDYINDLAEVSCIVNLGDSIDGNVTQEQTVSELDAVAKVFQGSSKPVFHVVGNHCLRAGREHLLRRLGIPSSYYTKRIASACLQGSWQVQETEEYLKTHSSDCNLQGWNGGVTHKQLGWLRATLFSAKEAGDQCIVMCHHPVGQGAGRETHRAWGSKDLERVINGSGNVLAVFSGHDHPGGYACVHGVHYIVLPAILEAPEDSTAFAVVTVFDTYMVIEGHGTVPSRTCKFKR